jgi:hypothetical protein
VALVISGTLAYTLGEDWNVIDASGSSSRSCGGSVSPSWPFRHASARGSSRSASGPAVSARGTRPL